MYTLYKFHFLNGISEINQLFDDILIIWPAPVYLVTHFSFYYYYYYYYLLHFVLSTRDNKTISDWLTSGKPPLALHFSYCSFCVLKNCVCHTLIYLWRAARICTARCHRLLHLTQTSVNLAQYLATFRPFWRLFSHIRYILTNLATFLKKP